MRVVRRGRGRARDAGFTFYLYKSIILDCERPVGCCEEERMNAYHRITSVQSLKIVVITDLMVTARQMVILTVCVVCLCVRVCACVRACMRAYPYVLIYVNFTYRHRMKSYVQL